MLTLHHTANHQTDVIQIEGRLTLNEAAAARRMIKRIVAAGHGKLIIDLSRLDYVDSMGLAVFVTTMKAMNERAGRVVLASIPQHALALIELTRLHSVFEIFITVKDALRSMSPMPAETLPLGKPEHAEVADPVIAMGVKSPKKRALLKQEEKRGILFRIWSNLLSLAPKDAVLQAEGKTPF